MLKLLKSTGDAKVEPLDVSSPATDKRDPLVRRISNVLFTPSGKNVRSEDDLIRDELQNVHSITRYHLGGTTRKNETLSSSQSDHSDIVHLKEDKTKFSNLDGDDVDEAKAVVRIRELLVSKQQKEHLNPKSIFSSIYHNKLSSCIKTLRRNPLLIRDTDAVGATPVHAAYLYEKYEIARWLVTNFPDESLIPYSSQSTYTEVPGKYMPYYGENMLHMCIIRRNHTEVRFLLDFYRDRLDSVPSAERRLATREEKEKNPHAFRSFTSLTKTERAARLLKGCRSGEDFVDFSQTGLSILLFAQACGTFFSINGDFYCGETPLHFAVCCGDTDMFDMVVAYASSENPNALFERDSHGNTLLHLCVMHNLSDMYKHVYAHAEARIRNQISLACGDSGPEGPYLEPVHGAQYDYDRCKFKEVFTDDDEFDGSCPRESILPLGTYDSEYIEKATQQKLAERFSLVLNSELHSPLTYAASLGNFNMLAFLIDQLKVTRWTYGPVSVSLVDLDGLDGPHNLLRYGPNPNWKSPPKEQIDLRRVPPRSASRPLPETDCTYIWGQPNGMRVHGAIEWLCIAYLSNQKMVEAFNNPFIEALINSKWDRSATFVFERDAIVAGIITFLLTLISCLINNQPTVRDNPSNGSVVLAILYPILFVFMSLLVLKELPQVIKYRLDYWGFFGGIRGAAIYEKLCMTSLMVSFYCLCLLEFIRASNRDEEGEFANSRRYIESDGELFLVDVGIEVCLVISTMSAWSYLFYSFMGFDATGPFVLKIFKIVTRDVPYFLQFFMIIILSFSCAVSMISNKGSAVFDFEYGFARLFMTIWTFMKITVDANYIGDLVDIANVPKDLEWLFDILMAFYGFMASLLMLNLLIAIISTSYDEYDSTANCLLLLERYNIMCAMERKMTDREIRQRIETFAIGEKIDIDGCVILPDSPENAIEIEGDAPSSGEEAPPIILDGITQRKSLSRRMVEGWRGAVTAINDKVDEVENLIAEQDKMNQSGITIRWNYKWEIMDDEWFNKKPEQEYMPDSETVKIILLIIDPQNDFHDDPADSEGNTRGYTGTLAVQGATADSLRISDMVMNNIDDIDEIYVTLDTHHKKHIAHACFWEPWVEKDKDGNDVTHPLPFDIITYEDVKSGKCVPRCDGSPEAKKELRSHCLAYTKELEGKGKFQLCIWPEHCLIGTRGQAIVPPLNKALNEWCRRTGRSLNFVNKTESHLTEMYSALEAEVPLPSDPTTMLNKELLARLKIADQLLVCGEAKSHCVNYTTRDIVKHWHKDKQRICILEDGCSSVPGFEPQGDKFFRDMEKEGVTLCKTTEAFDLFIGKNNIQKDRSQW